MPEALVTIAVAVVVHEGHVLVGRRSCHALEAAGLDEFPGGKTEAGETVAEAAARECLEETGIAVRVTDRSFGIASAQQSPPLMIIFRWATPIDPATRPTPPFAWIPIGQLAELNFPEANAAVLALLQQDQGGS
ncbi:MAG: NUDIX domain-containing protein [Planctomycetota bacterium]